MTHRVAMGIIACTVAGIALAACAPDELQRAKPTARVEGAICDMATHEFVANAEVTLTERDNRGNPISEHRAQTTAEGRFVVDFVGAGNHSLSVKKDAFQYQTDLAVANGSTLVLPEPSCDLPTGIIRGQVCDGANGRWFAGAEISVSSPKGLVKATSPADSRGAFEIGGVPAGERELVAEKDGLRIAYQVTVPADGEVDLGIHDCVLPGLSNIEGRICANKDGQWLAGAKVTVTVGRDLYQSTTDHDGRYVLRGLPAGHHRVEVEKGAFGVAFDADTQANKTTLLDKPVCTPSDVPVVVVSGEYDSVQKVMSRLSFSNVTIFEGWSGHNEVHDLAATRDGSWSGQLLDGPNPEIFNYKIAMFNCGLEESDLGPVGSPQRAGRIARLREFVEQGGFLYASDQAYDLIAGSFGAPIAFHDNGGSATAEIGEKQVIRDAEIVDPNLSATIDASRVNIVFRLPQWAVMSSVSDGAKVYVRGDVQVPPSTTITQAPLLVSFPLGLGKGVYASFHTDSQSSQEVDRMMDFLVFEL